MKAEVRLWAPIKKLNLNSVFLLPKDIKFDIVYLLKATPRGELAMAGEETEQEGKVPVVLVAAPDYFRDRNEFLAQPIRDRLLGRAEVVCVHDPKGVIEFYKQNRERVKVVAICSELPREYYDVGALTASLILEMGFKGTVIGVACCESTGFLHSHAPTLLEQVGCQLVVTGWGSVPTLVRIALAPTLASKTQHVPEF